MNNSFAFGGNNVSVIVDAGEINPGTGFINVKTNPEQNICLTACETVSSAGVGIAKLIDSVKNRVQNISQIPMAEGKMHADAALVPDFSERDIDRRFDLRNVDRPGRFAAAAAKLALLKAGFPDRPGSLQDVGFFLGISNPPSEPEREHVSSLISNEFRITQVASFPYVVPNSISGNVTRVLGLNGHNTVLCGSEGSGVMALGLAAKAIQCGHLQACLAGSVDEVSGRIAADLLFASGGNRLPFVPGEGAVMFSLETLEHAAKRNKKPLAFIRGMSFSTDTESLTGCECNAEKLGDMILTAIKDASLTPEDITIVCSNRGNITVQNQIIRTVCANSGLAADLVPFIGVPESSLPLFSLAHAITAADIETSFRTNYILCCFVSATGNCGAVVLETVKHP
jgi:3-oxoacyl-[acyl-carrier-protein] synthase II